MAPSALPQDIILLLCEELAHRHDLATLLQVSLVSRRTASVALEQLYSIYEYSPVFTGQHSNRKSWAVLWRSLIRSSLGQTAYPYCAFIRALSLSNYGQLLEDINYNRDEDTLQWLFDAEVGMDGFLVLREGQLTRKLRTRKLIGNMDFQKTILKCGDAITKYIKDVADEVEKAVALAHVESNYIPVDLLPSWVARLGTLASLRIQDGSALGVEAASAIQQCCPNFSELTCLSFSKPTADEDMAVFLQTLRSNSLKRFEVISMNGLSEKAITALNAHAETLRYLNLGSLSAEAMKCLNMLPGCKYLESLSIENLRHDQIDLRTFSDGLLKEITNWIQSCKSLTSLTFSNVRDSLLIVKDVLLTDDIKLNSLSLQNFASQGKAEDSSTWEALGHQTSLETLTLGGQDGYMDGLVVDDTTPLAGVICTLRGLKTLNLIQSSVQQHEIRQFVKALPALVDLKFGGENMDDTILDTLVGLSYLKDLDINATTYFTYEGLKAFALKLGAHPDRHRNVRVDILMQAARHMLSHEQQAWLSEYFSTVLEGVININYDRDPDEAHESDFTGDSE
ncbi:hypothetical protein PG994_011673 [Apiospora phragmitis]|uniref:F-box domain-containing protein n=1 Tax=Apiospora phragmitis TaxID=2905665 RepID=A0ABR1TTP8_9PEZI